MSEPLTREQVETVALQIDDELARLRTDNAALRAQLAEARQAGTDEALTELRNIANVDTRTWDKDVSNFQAWAQNRARFTIANIEREQAKKGTL